MELIIRHLLNSKKHETIPVQNADCLRMLQHNSWTEKPEMESNPALIDLQFNLARKNEYDV